MATELTTPPAWRYTCDKCKKVEAADRQPQGWRMCTFPDHPDKRDPVYAPRTLDLCADCIRELYAWAGLAPDVPDQG